MTSPIADVKVTHTTQGLAPAERIDAVPTSETGVNAVSR